MKLEQSFTVAASVDEVWAALIDVERIAPCLPGAEVTGVDDRGAYQGTFTVKLGPTTASYRGSLLLETADEAARTATMSAKGTDRRGQGGASATIVSTMREDAGATRVDVLTDFHITGRLARFGRSGMIEDISKRLLREFAQCLQASIEGDGAAAGPADAAGAAAAAAESGAGGPGPPSAPEPDPVEAAVASAGGAAAEAASAAAAPPGAEDLAEGPSAPAPADPASPPPLVGRPVESARPAEPEPEPKPEPPRTGRLSDRPDGGAEAPAAPPEPPAADSVRTESIPPPSRPDRPQPQAAKPKTGLGERIKRLFSRKKTR